MRHAGTPEARLDVLGSAVRQIRGLLACEAVDIGGATVTLPIGVRPVPILLAASGPRALHLAGAFAGIANFRFNLGTVRDFAATLDVFGREVLPAFADSP